MFWPSHGTISEPRLTQMCLLVGEDALMIYTLVQYKFWLDVLEAARKVALMACNVGELLKAAELRTSLVTW